MRMRALIDRGSVRFHYGTEPENHWLNSTLTVVIKDKCQRNWDFGWLDQCSTGCTFD